MALAEHCNFLTIFYTRLEKFPSSLRDMNEHCNHDWSSGHLWMVAYTINPDIENKSGIEQPKKIALDRCLKCQVLRVSQEGTPVKH